jgi:hypothetical protein
MLVLIVGPTVLAASEGDLDSPMGKALLGVAVLTVVGIGVSVVLAARTVGVLESALRSAWTLTSGCRVASSSAELPGGLHSFDRFASIRSAGVVIGVEAFANSLLT